MKKTAVILATAAVFDLGVMVVAGQARPQAQAQAQAQAQDRATPGPDNARPWTGKHLPRTEPSACRATGPGGSSDADCPAGQARGTDFFLKLDSLDAEQACTTRRGSVVIVEGVRQCRLPAASSGPAPSTRR
ncbi:hypothetical protein [Brevundimonas sp.]|uniref:hypothetical protein n=1 Tax=Brevundimonas sp. TaxID=1871086 RepID=UPI0027311713|nr:hypothetical protein [Brevundimonas sp.]MDP1914244.1 hypothetical protein [Brevundimonas sp.]